MGLRHRAGGGGAAPGRPGGTPAGEYPDRNLDEREDISIADILRYPAEWAEKRDQFGFFDDFLWYVTAHLFTSLASDTNSAVSVGDTVGGVLVINTGDAVDNNEAGVLTTNEIFLAASNKPIIYEAMIQYTEPNTNAGNVAVGMADVFGAANTLLDNGAGPAASFYGAMIYKVDGGTVWRCASSAGTLSSTGTTTASVQTAGGSSYQRLAIRIEPISGAFNSSRVSFFMDGLPLIDSSNKPIVHFIAHGAAATGEMNAGVYAKVGAANNSWTVLVDYVGAFEER